MTTQIKAIEQYFHVVLYIMLYKMFLTFRSLDEALVGDHCNESYWTVMSSNTVYDAVDEALVFDYSNESYWVVFSCGTVYYAVQVGSSFLSL